MTRSVFRKAGVEALTPNAREVARLLGIKMDTLNRWAKALKVPAKRLPCGGRHFDANAVLAAAEEYRRRQRAIEQHRPRKRGGR